MDKQELQDTAIAALEEFQDWWLYVTEYANLEGDYELPIDFYKRNASVCKQIENAERDVTPFHEIGSLVKRHAGIVSSGPSMRRVPDPHARISDLHNAIWRGLPARETYLNHLCDALDGKKKQTQKIKPQGKTVDIIRAIQNGKDNDEINTATGSSVENTRKVRSILKAGGYEI